MWQRESIFVYPLLWVVLESGEGAFSTVFKVKRISDGQEYALKKVRRKLKQLLFLSYWPGESEFAMESNTLALVRIIVL